MCFNLREPFWHTELYKVFLPDLTWAFLVADILFFWHQWIGNFHCTVTVVCVFDKRIAFWPMINFAVDQTGFGCHCCFNALRDHVYNRFFILKMKDATLFSDDRFYGGLTYLEAANVDRHVDQQLDRGYFSFGSSRWQFELQKAKLANIRQISGVETRTVRKCVCCSLVGRKKRDLELVTC